MRSGEHEVVRSEVRGCQGWVSMGSQLWELEDRTRNGAEGRGWDQ